jgi:hypothetical protein
LSEYRRLIRAILCAVLAWVVLFAATWPLMSLDMIAVAGALIGLGVVGGLVLSIIINDMAQEGD